MNYSAKRNILVALFSIIVFLFITCTEDPAGPGISDDLKPKGSITGWVYDIMNSRPQEGVLVSINADSADADVSDASGKFTVGNVLAGTYTLRFTHRNFDNDSTHTITISTGVNDTLADTVRLSYAFYILKGRIVYNSSPIPGAGVALAGYPITTLTDGTGMYILNNVPKNSFIKLISAKSGVGFNTYSPITGIPDDTTLIGDLALIYEGATVSGTVYDSSGTPAGHVIVAAVGGGLVDTTDINGNYKIENIPSNESTVRIYVPVVNGLYGATAGINVKDSSFITGVDIYLRPVADLQNGNGMSLVVHDLVVVDTVSTVPLSVYPQTDVNTVIHSYVWTLRGNVSTRTDTTYVPALSQLMSTLNKLAGIAGSRNVTVTVVAMSSMSAFSQPQHFTIMIRSLLPEVFAGGSDTQNGGPTDIVNAIPNKAVWFTGKAYAPFSGIDTVAWNFGDGTEERVSTDSIPVVLYLYDTVGTFYAVFRAKDKDGKEARDTVVVNITTSGIDKPLYSGPANGSTVFVSPGDSVPLVWYPVNVGNVSYSVYLDDKSNLLTQNQIIASSMVDTMLKVPVDTGKTYFWMIGAESGTDNANGAVWSFTVKAQVVNNNSPTFTATTMIGIATVGKLYSDTLKASDPDGDALTFSFLDSVAGMSLTDSVISWVPQEIDTGIQAVKVQVSDNKGGYDSLGWIITVNDSSINPEELVAYYPFNGNANDESGNGLNGTEQGGVALTTDRFGNSNSAYSFDGIDDYIEIPHNDILNLGTSDFAIALWLNISSNISPSDGEACAIYKISADGGFNINIRDAAEGHGRPRAMVRGSVDKDLWAEPQELDLRDDQWHYITLIRDGDNGYLYIDGQQNNSGTGFLNLNVSSTKPLYIGEPNISGGNGDYKGLIDDVTIFNCALSATQIDSLYHLNGWSPSGDSVADIDGNVYHIVKIGNQSWTVENLRTTRYNDGASIPHITDNTSWINDSSGAFCYYNNDSATNAVKYGALYNWYAVNTGKLAPAGWHVPDSADWDILQNFLIANGYNWDGTTTGNKIGKSMAAKTDWASSSTSGAIGNDLTKNNMSGFSALPGGYRGTNGNSVGIGQYSDWWSTTEHNASNANYCNLNYLNDHLGGTYLVKECGFSVRLVKD